VAVRLVNPHEVSFGGTSIPGCREARLGVRALRVERGGDDGDRYESYVEVDTPRYVIEVDCVDVPAAVGLVVGASGSLSFTVEKADGSGTMTVSAGSAVLAGQKTRFQNEAEGVSVTTLKFVCRSSSGSSAPVSMS